MAGLLAAIASIAGIAGAGTSIGEAIANSGGPPKPTATPTPVPTPPNAQTLLQQRAAVSQQEPNVIGATSGLANPEYNSLIAQILAGTLGQPGSTAAGNAATGQSTFTPANSQPTNAAINGTQINLSDFLSQQ
jgi:hypothetical protein